jgi:hypothetical protein
MRVAAKDLERIKARVNMARRWAGMLDRCYNEESTQYIWYGARGIEVCPEWHNFETFFDFWGEPPFPGASMGRIDNDAGYSPENCRWEDQGQQNNNSVRSKRITWKGKTQTLRDWAREYNVGARRLSERLRRGWDLQRALNTPCPKGYEQEAKERKEYTDKLWALNGHLYQARSRNRKGIRLGLPTQDLLAVEGAEPEIASNPNYSQNIQKVLQLRSKGLSIRKIAEETGFGKSTISIWLQTAKAESQVQP